MIPIDIDGQIKHQQNTVKIIEDFDDQESLPKEQAILASLEELKRIREVQVPVPEEPMWIRELRSDKFPASTDASLLQHIDTLRDLLKRESARADEMTRKYAERWNRAEAAEAKLAQIEKMGREAASPAEAYQVYVNK